MATISLCMIVKNEESLLARCLDCVRGIADEIVVVDTGSTDRTREIAAEYTDRVFDFVWTDDFSAARNYAYDRASMDYQMWLDADDVLPGDEAARLKKLKASLTPETDMVTMKYHTHFGPDGEPVLTSTRERLTRTEKRYRWQDPVHECIPLSGRILHSDIAVHHRKPPSSVLSTRNLNIYEALERKGAAFTPRQTYYFARELKDHRQWAKAAYYFERFLAGGACWAEDAVASCLALAACYRELGERARVLPTLLRSFEYASPRAEICCQLGYHYKELGDYKTALSWFQIAARLDAPDSLGFVLRDCWGFIPQIESCVCCCMLGWYDLARTYNKLAGAFKPDSAAVAQNERYLDTL